MCNLFRQIVSAGHGVSKNSCIDYACLVHFVTGIRFAPHLYQKATWWFSLECN